MLNWLDNLEKQSLNVYAIAARKALPHRVIHNYHGSSYCTRGTFALAVCDETGVRISKTWAAACAQHIRRWLVTTIRVGASLACSYSVPQ